MSISVMKALVWLFWLCICVLLGVGAATEVRAQSESGFAVQVAITQSVAEAEALANNLRERGLRSYWLESEAPGGRLVFAVRIGGQFASKQLATEFGRKLVQAKLIREFTIPRYETPGGTVGATGHALSERAVARGRNNAVTNPASARNSSKNANGPGTTTRLSSTETLPDRPLGPQQAEAPLVVPAPLNSQATAAKQKHQDEIELDDFKEFASPMLQGTIEAKDGQLLVTLQNRNSRHRFRGTVKWILSDGDAERPQPPMQIEIGPGQTQEFPLQGSGKSYLLTVQDEQGAPLLTQNGAFRFGGQPAVIAEAGTPRNIAPNTISQPGDVPVENQGEEIDDGRPRPPRPGEKVLLETANYPKEKESDPAEAKKDPVQPGDVKVIVRQVAETAENVTIEFEILAREPLGIIAMTIHTASTSDTKQAIMTTKQGRLPFLAPVGDTNGAVVYELRNEQGVILAAGNKPFRELVKQ